MIQSMTGYGAATSASDNYKVTVELKSLNSKYLEMVIKLPRVYVKYEHKIRNQLSKQLGRGKVVLLLNVEVLTAEKRTLNINQSLVKKYMEELQTLSDTLGIKQDISMSLLLDLPEVIPTDVDNEDPEEWALISKSLKEASANLTHSRKEEGNALD